MIGWVCVCMHANKNDGKNVLKKWLSLASKKVFRVAGSPFPSGFGVSGRGRGLPQELVSEHGLGGSKRQPLRVSIFSCVYTCLREVCI